MSGDAQIRVERLAASHQRAGFACEQPSLTDYLLKYAGQNARGDLASCYVALPLDSNQVLGFYTISAHALLCDELAPDLAMGLPRYDRIPAYLMGRLARDQTMRGRALGELLLIDALARLCTADAAGRMIVVDPIDDRARAFYARYGFAPLGLATSRMFLPMAVARRALR